MGFSNILKGAGKRIQKYVERGASKYIPVTERFHKLVPKKFEDSLGLSSRFGSSLSDWANTGQRIMGNGGKPSISHIASDARAYGETEVDLASMFDGATGQRFNAEYLRHIVTVENLSGIDALPPIPDNIVDPPIIWNQDMLKHTLTTWHYQSAACVGMDYTNRVLMRGQFLTLVPILLTPHWSGSFRPTDNDVLSYIYDKARSLSEITDRLNNTSYGFSAKIDSLRYWRSVNAHMKIAMMSLQIDGRHDKEEMLAAYSHLPEEIFQVLYNIQGKENFLQLFSGGKAFGQESESSTSATKVESMGLSSAEGNGDALSSFFQSGIDSFQAGAMRFGVKTSKWMSGKFSSFKKNIGSFAGKTAGSLANAFNNAGKFTQQINKLDNKFNNGNFGKALKEVHKKADAAAQQYVDKLGRDALAKGKQALGVVESILSGSSPNKLGEVARNVSYINMMKYVTNIDSEDSMIKDLPTITFYCNGPIEKTRALTVQTAESDIARQTTNVAAGALKSAVNSIAGGVGENLETYAKEFYYHSPDSWGGNTLVALTYIPNVIKGTMLDEQYNINIRHVCVSSDRFSLARMMWTFCKLLPFVVPVNEPNQPLIVPRTPFYCSAFSKGIMNIPRGAITSMSWKSDPAFQTTEGIPTEIDITLTIQPIYVLSAMPDFSDITSGGDASNKNFLAAAMFNPQSSFSLVATMCGQNTVLTKFQQGLFDYFVTGKIQSFWNGIKGSGHAISTVYRDWKTGAKINLKGVTSTRGSWRVR